MEEPGVAEVIELLRVYAGWLLATAFGLIAWLSRRNLKLYDDGLLRITQLEQTTVTNTQLEKIVDRLTAEQKEMHADILSYLGRIDNKIDKQEDESHNMALRVAALKAVVEERMPRSRVAPRLP